MAITKKSLVGKTSTKSSKSKTTSAASAPITPSKICPCNAAWKNTVDDCEGGIENDT